MIRQKEGRRKGAPSARGCASALCSARVHWPCMVLVRPLVLPRLRGGCSTLVHRPPPAPLDDDDVGGWHGGGMEVACFHGLLEATCSNGHVEASWTWRK